MTLDLHEIRTGDRSPELRTLMTPEGVEIEVRLAGRMERLGAVLLDIGVQWVFYIAAFAIFALIAFMFSSVGSFEFGLVLFLIAVVFFNFFYFLSLEVWMRGRTLGKRVFRLRVVGADGQSLKLSGLVVRNFMRQVELFLPLSIILSGTFGEGGYWSLLGFWVLGLASYICFDGDRRRLGDILGGTIVIQEPRPELLNDVADDDGLSKALFRFTPQQLETYGRYELQVLEGLLRQDKRPDRAEVLERVVSRICKKIDFGTMPPRPQHQAFLNDFYAAQRLHLEREALYGKRKETKDDTPPS